MSKLTHIFAAVLNINEGEVIDSLSPQNTPTWDSLNAIILLTEIERAFNMRFEYEEAMAIKNFGDVLGLISSKGVDPLV